MLFVYLLDIIHLKQPKDEMLCTFIVVCSNF